MNVHEVAAYLNIKERKVYDLVKQRLIPCSRVTGKWLFPQDRIDRWVAEGMTGTGSNPTPARDSTRTHSPPVVAGSHDPLLEWALRESECGLALMAGGSLDGLRRLAAGEAMVCGLHVLDSATGVYNVTALEAALASSGEGKDVILIEWAWRIQGLIVAPGNPLGIGTLTDLADKRPRMIQREAQAGTRLLLTHLLEQAGLPADALPQAERVAHTHTEVGLAILDGQADAGLGVEAVARQLRLDFIPLHRERYDLALGRGDYFEPPFQALLGFARGKALHQRAEELGGYDLSGLGQVHYNSP